MNRLSAILLLAAALMSMLGACSSDLSSGYTDISPAGWVYGDTVYFAPSDTDSVCIERGNILVVVRHTNGYEYSNIWLELDYTGADTTHTDTINMLLADDLGNWRGSGMGVSFQRLDTVARDVSIDVSRPIKVSHIMRVDTLADIEQIGIIFDRK